MSAPTDVTVAANPRTSRKRTNGNLLVGGTLVLLVIAMAVISLFWTPFDPTRTGDFPKLLAPGWPHLLGTDRLGIDVFSSIMSGAQTTLFVGVIAVGISTVIGVPIGLFAGSHPGAVDQLLMRVIDIMLAFPALLLAIILGAVFGGGATTAMIAIGIGNAPAFARVARSGTMTLINRDYIMAARATGRGTGYILMRHILPNISSLLIVQASISFGIAVLAEAALSYLGLGTTPPTPSWGRMVQESQGYIYSDPLQIVWPALAIAICVLGFNLLGDGLRDKLDPRLREAA